MNCLNKPWYKNIIEARFSDPPPRLMEIKTKINKLDLIKLKSSCLPKETINKMKRQPSELEKIIANKATDRGLISKIYKQLISSISEKQTNQSKKWVEDLNRHFSKENIQITNKHMKRCSTLLIIWEIQIRATVRYHPTSVGMAIIKNLLTQTNNAREDVEKREPSCTAGGKVNWYGHYGKHYGESLKN